MFACYVKTEITVSQLQGNLLGRLCFREDGRGYSIVDVVSHQFLGHYG
jgi:hypothetical protein